MSWSWSGGRHGGRRRGVNVRGEERRARAAGRRHRAAGGAAGAAAAGAGRVVPGRPRDAEPHAPRRLPVRVATHATSAPATRHRWYRSLALIYRAAKEVHASCRLPVRRDPVLRHLHCTPLVTAVSRCVSGTIRCLGLPVHLRLCCSTFLVAAVEGLCAGAVASESLSCLLHSTGFAHRVHRPFSPAGERPFYKNRSGSVRPWPKRILTLPSQMCSSALVVSSKDYLRPYTSVRLTWLQAVPVRVGCAAGATGAAALSPAGGRAVAAVRWRLREAGAGLAPDRAASDVADRGAVVPSGGCTKTLLCFVGNSGLWYLRSAHMLVLCVLLSINTRINVLEHGNDRGLEH